MKRHLRAEKKRNKQANGDTRGFESIEAEARLMQAAAETAQVMKDS